MHGSVGFDGWPDTVRIISEIMPGRVFLENVPAILSNYWGRVIGDLANLGYDTKWGVFCGPDAASNSPTIGARLFALATAIEHRSQTEEPFLAKRVQGWKPTLPSPANRSGWTSEIPEPAIQRISDGMAEYVGELKAIGNGQIPSLAALAWRTLT